jgi:cell division protein FtsI/penicillin-binding protein 2
MNYAPQYNVRRGRWFFVFVAVLIGIFWVRAFYLQVIRHDYYVGAAKSDQLKEYQIPAARGLIQAYNGDELVPIVLNQKLYTIYADPTLVKNHARVAESLAAVLGGDIAAYEAKLRTPGTRYVIIAKKIEAGPKQALLKYKYPGVGAQEVPYRIYPNGALAAQLLGFVNDEGAGVYGVEEALNSKLAGKPGQLKAVTDINGIPLAANRENVETAPVGGNDLILTIDIAMQKQLESILQKGVARAKSKHGSALIMDVNSGAVKAMANWPTFDPGKYYEVEDPSVFNNGAASKPLEPGSSMKTLTTAAALDLGAIKPDTTYNDPAQWTIDSYKITNVETGRIPARRSIADILNLSINTGATWMLMQMSKRGDTDISKQGRERWYDYLHNHYRFGRATGIELGYEAEGSVPQPNSGFARDLTYANTTFGQAMTATPLQMAAAYAAVLNGGTYYQPRLIDKIVSSGGKTTVAPPKVLKRGVVAPRVSEEIVPLLEYSVENHSIGARFDQRVYSVGGKTGTAQVAKSGGGYKEHDFNGTYVGFVGGDRPEYVIAVVVYEPKIGGYAGSVAAQPIFADLGEMLIDNFGVTPRN